MLSSSLPADTDFCLFLLGRHQTLILYIKINMLEQFNSFGIKEMNNEIFILSQGVCVLSSIQFCNSREFNFRLHTGLELDNLSEFNFV